MESSILLSLSASCSFCIAVRDQQTRFPVFGDIILGSPGVQMSDEYYIVQLSKFKNFQV